MSSRSPAIAFVLAGGSFALLYQHVLAGLVGDWSRDDNYSHGFFIIPLALYFAWDRRARLAAAPTAPSLAGLLLVLTGLSLLLVGRLGAELFLTRVSILVVIAGSVVFLSGWRVLRVLAFPVTFLLLMIPIPAILFNQVAFPLQLLASELGRAALSSLGVPVLREGNVMTLATTTLEVADACSGIRSLISLVTLGVVYGYFVDPRGVVRTLIVLTTVPIAILVNGARVAGTGVAAHYYGPGAAQGFFHTFSGWVVFIVALALVWAAGHVLLRLAPRRLVTSPTDGIA